MSTLSNLVANRRAIVDQIAALKEDLAVIDAELTEQLGGDPYDDGEVRVSIASRTTLDKKRAEVLLATADLSEDALKEVYTTVVDPRALKEYAPDLYEEASKTSAPYVIMKGA